MLHLIVSAALAATAPAGPADAETYIPFPQTGFRSWDAPDDRTLLIVDQQRRWYRVELMQACTSLPYSYQVKFESRTPGRFDRTSTVSADGQTCSVSRIVRIEAPEGVRQKKEKS
jgi:hypothetical protein